MTIMVLYLAVIAGIAGWWLSRQRLAALPWLEVGLGAAFPRTQASPLPSAKIGLGLFLGVATCVFALLFSAFVMRTGAATPNLAEGALLLPPLLLWVNTGTLIVASAALQLASTAARRGQRGMVLAHLVAGGIATLAFIAGQVLAWRILTQAGVPIASSQANTFFYTLTGAHGLHVLGGLIGLGRAFAKALRAAPLQALRLSVQLCAWYWHFLLLVWVAVLALLLGAADALTSLCSALVS